MLTHLLGDGTQVDGSEVVDRETSVLRVVHREHTAARHPDFGVLEAFCNRLEAHALRNLVEHDLDEYTGTGRRVVFGQLDAVEYVPGDRVRGDEMTEETRNIPQPVRLVSVDCLVVLAERLFEAVEPDAVDSAETLSNQTIEGRVRAFLRATLDDHLAELNLYVDSSQHQRILMKEHT